jgi:hypothetical protein
VHIGFGMGQALANMNFWEHGRTMKGKHGSDCGLNALRIWLGISGLVRREQMVGHNECKRRRTSHTSRT